ncbi:hypothetical protein UA08_07252 [Talaromyces atroroseus]|uniref:Uncharacterized protein n=1 Tax=Talaromyces atroroseus TaxID=1441469 RepID=A0A225AT24_TALAT|nr:hypothetical protein UA08_07252 [Talaromyces atroroseus]OKL57565.1 hypothetical protein UA08_07252 [Talaromyces atroroseus]
MTMYSMDSLEELSILDYARSKRIATDHLNLDPSDLLGQLRDYELAYITSTTEDLTPSPSNLDPPTAGNDKLELDRDGARFLSSVLKDVSSLQADARSIPEEFDSFASLKYSPRHDLKVDIPLLTFEEERAMKTFGKGHNPIAIMNELVPELANREEANLDESLEFPDYFWELPTRILQLAMGYLDERRHKEEIERLYIKSDLASEIFRRRPTSPLYIEPEGQEEYRHSSDSSVDVIWSPDTERDLDSRKDSLTSCETVGGHPIRNNVPQNMTRCCISPEQVGYVEASIAGELLKHTPRQPVTANNPTDSPSFIKTQTEQAPKRTTPLSQPTGFPVPLPGSLGTLSAFMQTRRQRNKRRKLGSESQYFSSLSEDSNGLPGTDESSIFKKPDQPVKLSSPPLHTHETQNLYSYPGSMKPTATPLTLILSTHLLRTESALVRSFESTTSSQSTRLIFRDFTYPYPPKGGISNQSHVIEEADLLVSPTTGIILSSSHETTQKYLPEQGTPGIESPLKARIVRVVPRYEMLYVLIRSPTKLCINTLSSIRELTAFCMSLGRLCTVRVLITSPDHVFEWIMSIAAKHFISHEVEGISSLCPDEQTQWEVFLRKAGLNSFAAQVVLSTLKTGHESNGLSRFVEMPSTMRRDMFEKILGDRVLKRVDQTLEMDWQVDWSTGLLI